MKITRQQDKRRRYYFIDGKIINHGALDELLRKYLTSDGLIAFWNKLTKDNECTLDFDVIANFDEQDLLTRKIAELQQSRAEIAALEKKLMQARIKAAKYDCLMSAMKSA